MQNNIDGLELKRRGLMLILSSPSGAGKTTIAQHLLARDPNLALSISVTTRPQRPGERPDQDYYFVSEKQFSSMVEQGDLLEHAKIFDHGYGTPKHAVEQALSTGKDVLFDIDWQGTQQLRQNARNDVVGVFILPPSTVELERRLYDRAQDSAAIVAKRMNQANFEMSHWPEYDYVIVNQNLEQSVQHVHAILIAERHRRDRLENLNEFVKHLARNP